MIKRQKRSPVLIDYSIRVHSVNDVRPANDVRPVIDVNETDEQPSMIRESNGRDHSRAFAVEQNERYSFAEDVRRRCRKRLSSEIHLTIGMSV